MYSNNIKKFQVSTTILNACTKDVWKLIECTTYDALGPDPGSWAVLGQATEGSSDLQ